jgi:hypothetical protein
VRYMRLGPKRSFRVKACYQAMNFGRVPPSPDFLNKNMGMDSLSQLKVKVWREREINQNCI